MTHHFCPRSLLRALLLAATSLAGMTHATQAIGTTQGTTPIVGAAPVQAAAPASPSPAEAVQRLFTTPQPEAGWFAPAFLAAVPLPQITALLGSLSRDFGPFSGIELAGRSGTLRLERAELPVTVSLDAAGRIDGLLFGAPSAVAEPLDAIAARLVERAEGAASVLVRIDGEDRVAIAADTPMAVGSAFKLAVLRAYEDAVREGRLRRDQVVALEAADRSLPSGALHTLAPGTPVTPELLAGLMIQHSDNTATDALLRLVGREAVERISPRNRPFLATAELFKLAAGPADARRQAFGQGGESERRAMLDRLRQAPLPAATDLPARASWREAEWYFTARELCDLLLGLRDAPALNGTPDPVVATAGWPWTGYKGGSEFGVLNLSAAGQTPDGRQVCAVFTANGDRAQAEQRLALSFSGLFRGLGQVAR